MPLPRATDGQVGPFTASDMNRMAKATEAVEASGEADGGQARPALGRIRARLGAEKPGTSSFTPPWRVRAWEQVWPDRQTVLQPWAFQARPGGLSSTSWPPNQGYAVCSPGFNEGDICLLERLPTAKGDTGVGQVLWLAVPVGPLASVGAGVIKAVTQTGNQTTLGYAGYVVGLVLDAGTDLFTGGGPLVPAINMFEYMNGLQLIVANMSPGTKTIQRLSVGDPTGPIALLPSQSGELWQFNVSNAFQVSC